MSAARLPRLEARDLDGSDRLLPDDLPADPCVVILAFRMRQQGDVDAWVAALGEGTPVVEVPVLGRKWRRANDDLPDPDVPTSKTMLNSGI